jgi:ribosome maturation factor RimP
LDWRVKICYHMTCSEWRCRATLLFCKPEMSTKSLLIDEIERLAAPVLQEHGAELVYVEFVHEHGNWVLRFFLDKPNGITLDDCATLSEHLGRNLDATNLIPQSYSLEVSSPGIYRPLRKEKDFERFKGERADIQLFAPLNGRRHFRGTIEGVAEGQVQVKDVTEQVFSLPLSGIAKAKLDPEITI